MPRATRSIVRCLLLAAVVAACGGGGPGSLDDDPFASVRPGGGVGQGTGNQPVGGGGLGLPNVGGGTLGIPDWLRVGVRLTWYSSAASVAQSRFQWVEDPNGAWEDPTTGKKYSRSNEAGGTGQPGASGDGITQVDVLAVEGTDVVLLSNRYAVNRTGAQATLDWSIGPGAKVSGLAVDGAWVHPAYLAQIDDPRLAGLLVLRGPYQVGNAVYQATAFTSTSGGVYVSYVYDSVTGILLSATTSTAGATSPFAAPGENPPVGNTQLTYTQFLGLRQRSLPGLGAPAPGWVAGTAGITYGGIYNITNPVNPAAGSFNYQITFSVSFGQGGPSWRPYEARSVIQTLGEQTPVSSVTGSTGLYWWDPAALAGMQQGQVLDQDPIIGQQTVVSAAGGGAGGNIVAIDVIIPGTVYRASYDRNSGTMVAYTLQTAASGTTLQMQLQGG